MSFEYKVTANTPEELDQKLAMLADKLNKAQASAATDIIKAAEHLATISAPVPPQSNAQAAPASTPSEQSSYSAPQPPLPPKPEYNPPSPEIAPPPHPPVANQSTPAKRTKKEAVELGQSIQAMGATEKEAVKRILDEKGLTGVTKITVEQADEMYDIFADLKDQIQKYNSQPSASAVPQSSPEPTPPAQVQQHQGEVVTPAAPVYAAPNFTPPPSPPVQVAPPVQEAPVDEFAVPAGFGQNTGSPQQQVTPELLKSLAQQITATTASEESRNKLFYIISNNGGSSLVTIPAENWNNAYSELQALLNEVRS